MINKRTDRKIVWIVLGAFLFLATTGLTVTANMNPTMEHNCPFTKAGVEDCVMMTSGTEQTAVHHMTEFKSFLNNTFTSGFTSLITLLTLAAGMLFLIGVRPQDKNMVFARLVLSIREHARPPTFYKIKRWLVLHSKNLIPDYSRTLVLVS